VCISQFHYRIVLAKIINTKKHTKTACTRRVSVQLIIEKLSSFIKVVFLVSTKLSHWKISNFVNFQANFATLSDFRGFILLVFYHLKALENKEFSNFNRKNLKLFKILSNFLTFFENPYFFLTFVIILVFPNFS